MVHSDGIEEEVLTGLDQPHLPIIPFREVVAHAGTARGKLLNNEPLPHELKQESVYQLITQKVTPIKSASFLGISQSTYAPYNLA